MIILGIDPGTATTGFGVIDYNNNEFKYIDYGCILTKVKTPLHERLDIIHTDLVSILKEYKPEHVAVENLFFFNNAKTALSVGHARGIILQTAFSFGAKIAEYTPLQVKQAVTGYGKADKHQIQKMVQSILNLDEIPTPDDAADGLAIAITHAGSLGFAGIRDVAYTMKNE